MSIIASPSLVVNNTPCGVVSAAEAARYCASAASPDEAVVVWGIAALRRPFEVRIVSLGDRRRGLRLELEIDGVVHHFTFEVLSDIWLAVYKLGGRSRRDGLRRVLVDWPVAGDVAMGMGQ